MGASDPFRDFPLEEIGVVLAPDKASGVLVNTVVQVDISKVSHCQKARDIGVIHQETVAETVHLKSIYVAVFRMCVCRMFLEGASHFIGQ